MGFQSFGSSPSCTLRSWKPATLRASRGNAFISLLAEPSQIRGLSDTAEYADSCIICQGPKEARLARRDRRREFEEAGRHEHPWGMAEENGPIHICRGLKTPLAELWPQVKHWN